jgi:YVTN family beta-propeller protein
MVIDGSTLEVEAEIEVPRPTGVAVNPLNNRVYVSSSRDDALYVLDGESNQIITTIPVSDMPGDILVNPLTDHVFVMHRSDDPLSVVDGAELRVIAELDLGNSPTTGTINPWTGRLYIASWWGNTVYVIADEPSPEQESLTDGLEEAAADGVFTTEEIERLIVLGLDPALLLGS